MRPKPYTLCLTLTLNANSKLPAEGLRSKTEATQGPQPVELHPPPARTKVEALGFRGLGLRLEGLGFRV